MSYSQLLQLKFSFSPFAKNWELSVESSMLLGHSMLQSLLEPRALGAGPSLLAQNLSAKLLQISFLSPHIHGFWVQISMFAGLMLGRCRLAEPCTMCTTNHQTTQEQRQTIRRKTQTPFRTWHCWTTWCMSNATGAVFHCVYLNDCFSDEVPLRCWSPRFPKDVGFFFCIFYCCRFKNAFIGLS